MTDDPGRNDGTSQVSDIRCCSALQMFAVSHVTSLLTAVLSFVNLTAISVLAKGRPRIINNRENALAITK